MKYEPRSYWSARLRRQGKNYVAYKNQASAFDKQSSVFWEAVSGYFPKGGRVLDFGCGVGRFAPVVANVVDQYDGVDLTEEALKYAPEIENAQFTFLSEDLLPFADNMFNGAFALTVLQHIVADEDFSLWTSELARVIKPGGFFIGVETPELPKRRAPKGPAAHMKWRTAEIIAEALGGEVEDSHFLSAEFENSHYCFLARL